MQELLDILQGINAELDKLDGRTVERRTYEGGRDREVEDLTERVSHELAKKMRREGLL